MEIQSQTKPDESNTTFQKIVPAVSLRTSTQTTKIPIPVSHSPIFTTIPQTRKYEPASTQIVPHNVKIIHNFAYLSSIATPRSRKSAAATKSDPACSKFTTEPAQTAVGDTTPITVKRCKNEERIFLSSLPPGSFRRALQAGATPEQIICSIMSRTVPFPLAEEKKDEGKNESFEYGEKPRFSEEGGKMNFQQLQQKVDIEKQEWDIEKHKDSQLNERDNTQVEGEGEEGRNEDEDDEEENNDDNESEDGDDDDNGGGGGDDKAEDIKEVGDEGDEEELGGENDTDEREGSVKKGVDNEEWVEENSTNGNEGNKENSPDKETEVKETETSKEEESKENDTDNEKEVEGNNTNNDEDEGLKQGVAYTISETNLRQTDACEELIQVNKEQGRDREKLSDEEGTQQQCQAQQETYIQEVQNLNREIIIQEEGKHEEESQGHSGDITTQGEEEREDEAQVKEEMRETSDGSRIPSCLMNSQLFSRSDYEYTTAGLIRVTRPEAPLEDLDLAAIAVSFWAPPAVSVERDIYPANIILDKAPGGNSIAEVTDDTAGIETDDTSLDLKDISGDTVSVSVGVAPPGEMQPGITALMGIGVSRVALQLSKTIVPQSTNGVRIADDNTTEIQDSTVLSGASDRPFTCWHLLTIFFFTLGSGFFMGFRMSNPNRQVKGPLAHPAVSHSIPGKNNTFEATSFSINHNIQFQEIFFVLLVNLMAHYWALIQGFRFSTLIRAIVKLLPVLRRYAVIAWLVIMKAMDLFQKLITIIAEVGTLIHFAKILEEPLREVMSGTDYEIIVQVVEAFNWSMDLGIDWAKERSGIWDGNQAGDRTEECKSWDMSQTVVGDKIDELKSWNENEDEIWGPAPPSVPVAILEQTAPMGLVRGITEAGEIDMREGGAKSSKGLGLVLLGFFVLGRRGHRLRPRMGGRAWT